MNAGSYYLKNPFTLTLAYISAPFRMVLTNYRSHSTLHIFIFLLFYIQSIFFYLCSKALIQTCQSYISENLLSANASEENKYVWTDVTFD